MITFIAGLAAFIALALAMRARGRVRRAALGLTALAFVALLVGTPRGLALDKVLARLVLPAGFLWLVLCGAAWIAFVRRRDRAAVGLTALAVVYWLTGAPVVGQWLLNRVESPYAQLDPLSLPPLDAAVVLGGGTRDVEGRPRLDEAGDRVLLGAQLFRVGKVRRLITTGSSIPELGPARDLTKETALLWQSLGIPESAIVRLPQPKNTAQEIEVVKSFVETSTIVDTVGLVTSAWHLPRALALCDRAGLDVVPLPADVRTTPIPSRNLQDFIPDGRGFADVHTAGWEILGRAVGR